LGGGMLGLGEGEGKGWRERKEYEGADQWNWRMV
jgi:hypothetical protein